MYIYLYIYVTCHSISFRCDTYLVTLLRDPYDFWMISIFIRYVLKFLGILTSRLQTIVVHVIFETMRNPNVVMRKNTFGIGLEDVRANLVYRNTKFVGGLIILNKLDMDDVEDSGRPNSMVVSKCTKRFWKTEKRSYI